jgi:small neutral amino acid transporter SnatA (MarC family)
MGIRGAPFGIYAALLIVLADMILAPFAVTRLNAQRVPSAARQRIMGLAVVALAFAIAALTVDT